MNLCAKLERFLKFCSAHPSEVAKCNTQTGHWVKKQGKCRPKWEPKCDIPSTQKGGYWNCATMLTDPKAPREAELPELHDVTGLTTADLVSRNVGMTERWYAEPELGKISNIGTRIMSYDSWFASS